MSEGPFREFSQLEQRIDSLPEAELFDYYVQLGHRLIAIRELGEHYARPEELDVKATEAHLAAGLIEGRWLYRIIGKNVDLDTIRRYL